MPARAPRLPACALLLALGALAVGCPGDDGPGATVARFQVPRGGAADADYFALPWPSDVRRDADGTVGLAGSSIRRAIRNGPYCGLGLSKISLS